jgi:hypothetical protein
MSGKVRFTVEHRFWSKVDKSGGPNACWPWTGCRMRQGHGQFRIHTHESILAHRLSWVLTNGPIPEGKFVCHHCDHGWCCNPRHLFVGTHQDNMDDMHRKGRGFSLFLERPEVIRGEANSHAKLNTADVVRIRELEGFGVSRPRIAKMFGISRQNVRFVATRKTWRHVP